MASFNDCLESPRTLNSDQQPTNYKSSLKSHDTCNAVINSYFTLFFNL
uniref:Uncharacterized protein n=1 Tax=Anguilla anguilla TaxID=7936 RepID=A0A0E9V9J3_ANGAN